MFALTLEACDTVESSTDEGPAEAFVEPVFALVISLPNSLGFNATF